MGGGCRIETTAFVVGVSGRPEGVAHNHGR